MRNKPFCIEVEQTNQGDISVYALDSSTVCHRVFPHQDEPGVNRGSVRWEAFSAIPHVPVAPGSLSGPTKDQEGQQKWSLASAGLAKVIFFLALVCFFPGSLFLMENEPSV